MKITNIHMETFDTLPNSYHFISDWYDLAVVTGIKPQTIAYILKNKKEHAPGTPESVYTRWVEKQEDKVRVGYSSSKILKFTQNRLVPLLSSLYAHIPTDHLLAYMKGKTPYDALQKTLDRKYMITFDVVGYYDNITFQNLVDMFLDFGFNRLGAKLITRLATCKRPTGKPITTLQQGSPISPMISNLVGHYLFDAELLRWLDTQREAYPRIDIIYHRYCDNFFISLDKDIPMGFIHDIQLFVTDLFRRKGFEYHKWNVTPLNHPRRNQAFLGVVLNKVMRIDRRKLQTLKATLFNACTKGLTHAVDTYWDENAFWHASKAGFYFESDLKQLQEDRFLSVITGKISFLKKVNSVHYTELHKLLTTAKILKRVWEFVWDDDDKRLSDEIFGHVKTYRDGSVSEEDYLQKLVLLLSNQLVPEEIMKKIREQFHLLPEEKSEEVAIPA